MSHLGCAERYVPSRDLNTYYVEPRYRAHEFCLSRSKLSSKELLIEKPNGLGIWSNLIIICSVQYSRQKRPKSSLTLVDRGQPANAESRKALNQQYSSTRQNVILSMASLGLGYSYVSILQLGVPLVHRQRWAPACKMIINESSSRILLSHQARQSCLLQTPASLVHLKFVPCDHNVLTVLMWIQPFVFISICLQEKAWSQQSNIHRRHSVMDQRSLYRFRSLALDHRYFGHRGQSIPSYSRETNQRSQDQSNNAICSKGKAPYIANSALP
eukprot:TRINITY_DN2272_c0_g1_i5.p1 TRINITY_DN2272_c0_g1~~TRINITY_DN2272_c0_g1_i5.p1  ORF type:complete len:271 (+),score=-59.83 TRINITY_DN2272_c0_g1_i5:321-1133(+)